jgi:hypothetical protein
MLNDDNARFTRLTYSFALNGRWRFRCGKLVHVFHASAAAQRGNLRMEEIIGGYVLEVADDRGLA